MTDVIHKFKATRWFIHILGLKGRCFVHFGIRYIAFKEDQNSIRTWMVLVCVKDNSLYFNLYVGHKFNIDERFRV